MNEFILIGRIANKLPKVEELDDKPLFLSLAVDKIIAGRKTTRFIPINVWGKEAENLCIYKKQGDEIVVKGEIDMSIYTKDGKDISKVALNSKKIIYTSGSAGKSNGEDESIKEECKKENKEETNISLINENLNDVNIEVNTNTNLNEKIEEETETNGFGMFDFGPLV